MQVKIVKAYNDKIWYSNRVGQVFDCKRLQYGYLVLSNGYLFIHEKDGEIIPEVKVDDSILGRVLNILLNEPLTWFEVYRKYVEDFVRVSTITIKHKVYYLQLHRKIRRTNTQIKNDNNRPCNVFEVIKK